MKIGTISVSHGLTHSFNKMCSFHYYFASLFTLLQFVALLAGAPKAFAEIRQFPLLDALIAAGAASPAPSSSFTLEEMKAVLSCTTATGLKRNENNGFVLSQECNKNEEIKIQEGMDNDFSGIAQNIKEVIDLALPLAQMPSYKSRFMEYASEVFSVGDNYAHEQKSVTMVCVTFHVLPATSGDFVYPAAYAGHLFSHLDHGQFPPASSFQNSNMSIILEADVMELPVAGALFVPKQYCLDLDVINTASDEAFEEAPPSLSLTGARPQIAQTLSKASQPLVDTTFERTRTIALGTKEEVFKSSLNRFSWITNMMTNHTLKEYMINAFETPKVELLGLLGVWRVDGDGLCDTFTIENTVDENITCLTNAARTFLDERQLEYDEDALTYALFQLGQLDLRYLEWKDEHPKHVEAISTFEEIAPQLPQEIGETIVNQIVDSDGNSVKDIANYLFPTPPLYERTATDIYKNMGAIGMLHANPFISEDLARSLTVVSGEDYMKGFNNELEKCHNEKDQTFSSKALGAGTYFPGALRRRMYERGQDVCQQVDATIKKALPSSNVSQWFYENFRWFGDANALNEKYIMNQSVTWLTASDGYFELGKGNLTQKELGRTQDKLFVTNFQNPTSLQPLLTAQLNSNIYSRAATKATYPDHPCEKAVDNWEIFVFVLTIILSAFGVNGVLQGIHLACHWWCMISPCCARCRPTSDNAATSNDTENKEKDKNASSCYDVCLIFIGLATFVALYVPLILQIKDEFKVANFETSAVDMETQNTIADDAVIELSQGGWGTLVTFVHSRTYCEEARPWILVSLLIGGIVVAAVINAPYIHRARQVLAFRFCNQQQQTTSGSMQTDPKLQSISADTTSNVCADVENLICKGTARVLQPVTMEDRFLFDCCTSSINRSSTRTLDDAHNEIEKGVPVQSTTTTTVAENTSPSVSPIATTNEKRLSLS